MNEAELHLGLTWLQIALAVLTVVAVSFIRAPYGRHARKGWGPSIPSRWGWIGMEMPAVAFFIWLFFQGQNADQLVPLLLLGVWQLHYIHRTLIFPFRIRADGKTMPLFVATLAFIFQVMNSYINARWLSEFSSYTDAWLTDPRFIIGLLIFFAGFAINLHADTVLIHLRKPGETGYKIPEGGMYRFITCPNYFGEILEWTGFAIASWSLPGLAFALYTAANVGPRAFSNHQWYLEKFPDYPKERKALIPFIA
jgi:steroid 5-alpha-reductase/3-oxo-5-alpha-steroid 4-dehydrogenase 1